MVASKRKIAEQPVVKRSMAHNWQWQDAENRFGALVNQAENIGPQIISRNGEQVAVVLSLDDYSRLTKPKTDLVEFFQSSPLAQVALDLGRRD